MAGDNTDARRTAAIFAWLNQVKSDASIRGAFKGAFQLTQKISSVEFEKTGDLVTWQSQATIGKEIGAGERTARTMITELVEQGHVSIKGGHGNGRSNRYTLVLKRQDVAGLDESQQEEPGRLEANQSGKMLPVENSNRQVSVVQPATSCSPTGKMLPPNLSSNHSSNSKSAENGALRSKERAPLPAWAKPAGSGRFFIKVESAGGDLIRRYCQAQKRQLPVISQREDSYIADWVMPPGSAPAEAA